MVTSRHRLKSLLGYGVIAGIWGGIFCLLAYFGFVYAVYADLKDSSRSRLTAGTPAEIVADQIYDRFRSLMAVSRDEQLIYVPTPGATRVSAPEFDTVATMTPEGLRQQPPYTGADAAPILVVGDSFTLGMGVTDEQTFSCLLQTRYGYRTVNAGVASYGGARELTRLRRLGLLNDAAMLVMQFCWNDATENHNFVANPTPFFAHADPGEVWSIQQKYGTNYGAFNYGTVLNATSRYLRYRIKDEGFLAVWRDLLHRRLPECGAPMRVRGGHSAETMATDFLRLLDQFPEIAGKPILVMEMNGNGARTGFLEALAVVAKDRPNVRTVPLSFELQDFFRFDKHLVPRGHEKVAAALDGAIREFRADLAAPR